MTVAPSESSVVEDLDDSEDSGFSIVFTDSLTVRPLSLPALESNGDLAVPLVPGLVDLCCILACA